MSYVPHTANDIKEMLDVIGVEKIDDLFTDVPKEIKYSSINEIKSLSESELLQSIESDLAKNTQVKASFLGAGSYNHYIPSVVGHLAGRSEFYTAYTPYQPEISQGTLSAIFEFQSMICELTGTDISNASLYDGGSAVAEAVMMALNFTKKNRVITFNKINPKYVEVVNTYIEPRNISVDEGAALAEDCAAVLISVPDFYGTVSQYQDIIKDAHEKNVLVIVIADPLLLSVVEAPGKLGADIVVGEGQPLGIPQSFGGPGLGFMGVNKSLIRFTPGRIVGKTMDADGKEAFVLTMQTREQHIRREKATSNICSNQALCALRATIYMSVMGAQGMRSVVALIKQKSDYAKEQICKLDGFKVVNDKNNYREFVIECPEDVSVINKKLLAEGIIGGLDLGDNKMLVCCTEQTTNKQIDLFAEKLLSYASVLAISQGAVQ